MHKLIENPASSTATLLPLNENNFSERQRSHSSD